MERDTTGLREVRILAVVFLAYAILLPLLGIIIPAPDLPPSEGSSLISLVMMILMPVDLLLVYIFYRFLGSKTTAKNVVGIGALLFVIGTSPSIYGFIIGFTNPLMRIPSVLIGLAFGLAGMFLAWMLVNRISESIVSEST